MNDKEIIDMLLRLEARITQLENHYHITRWDREPTTKPKIRVGDKERRGGE